MEIPEALRLSDLDLRGKRLLLRCDLNVPVESGRVADDFRIRAALPGIRAALEAGAAVVAATHLGRPKGRFDAALSVRPVAERLAGLLPAPVRFRPEPVRPGARPPGRRPAGPAPGEALVLENLRFHPGEEANDPDFAAALAAFGDEYANDAFGAAHRRHASVDACARRFPRAAGGPLLEREVAELGSLLGSPRRPFVAVLGGAKISDKAAVVESLLARADRVLLGGAMAYTFLAARGVPTGRSLVEPDRIAGAARLLARCADRLDLPLDHRAAPVDGSAAGEEPAPPVFPEAGLPVGWRGLDIGPETAERYAAEIGRAATVLWNGPLGLAEDPRFAGGTNRIAAAVAEAADRGAATVVGGGDSLAAVRRAGFADRIGHLSTGGGAALAFLAGEPLPGLDALAASGRRAPPRPPRTPPETRTE